MESTQVFKVFDEEWEEIMGSEQLKKFAIDQILNNYQYENDEDLIYTIEDSVTASNRQEIKNLIKQIFDKKDATDLTNEQAIEILKIRNFKVKELDVH